MASGIEFDEDKYGAIPKQTYSQQQANVSGMAGWLMKKGIAKSPMTAQWIMLAFVAVNLVLAYIIYAALS